MYRQYIGTDIHSHSRFLLRPTCISMARCGMTGASAAGQQACTWRSTSGVAARRPVARKSGLATRVVRKPWSGRRSRRSQRRSSDCVTLHNNKGRDGARANKRARDRAGVANAALTTVVPP